jgi:NADH-quinone oxidoreductase subunit A
MLEPYWPLFILLGVSIALVGIMFALDFPFGPRRHPNPRKMMPYESGVPPYGPGTRRVPVPYLLVSILFIIFDVDIIFFLLWTVVFRSLGMQGFIEVAIFAVVLLVAFVYAWKKGALEWD